MNPQGTNPYPYPHYPNPNPNPSPTFASAPPFSHYPSYPPDPSPVPQPYAPHPNPPSDPYLSPGPIHPHDPERPDLSAPRFDYAPERPDLAAGRFDYPAGRPDYGTAGRSDYGTAGRSDYGAGRFDYGVGRSDYGAGRSDYGAGRSDNGAGRYDYGGMPELVNSRLEQEFGGGNGRVEEDVFGDGVYAYSGGRVEPYGARGTKVSSSSAPAFDDYGRSISFSGSQKESGGGLGKVVKAVPKVEVDEDAKSGVSKFRVNLLAESAGQTTMDVVCQIGFNGILMLEPNTKRTLRIYPLGTITKWEINSGDPSICQFWSKSPVDIEPRRIRLQSNRYTSSTILDVIAASTVQLKEMGGTEESGIGKGTSGSSGPPGQSAEKKKGLIDWMNIIKPPNEEKDHWVPDMVVSKCTSCGADFGAFLRRHHCRNCGDIFCDKCTTGRTALTADEQAPVVRVCDRCMAEVTRRLEIAKEVANKPVGLRTHDDLAKKLQEELEKKCKVSSGKKSSNGSSSGRRMREVACPTCTVHLQVQVPSSGSETIECGVCQHPFLISSR